MTTQDTNLESCLRDRFGLDAFRPGQRDVIETVLARRDCLCVMPTGGGKSLCYQLPSLLLDGVTLVVSPLIALMKDQVDGLVEHGIRATLINSTLDTATQNERIAATERGEYDLVYIAPERFRSGRFNESIARTRVALLAIDEAHCISEWGHDFRPDYIRLGRARKRLGNPPTIALTATATDNVRRDICEQLELADPRVFVTGFDRPNLRYEVRFTSTDSAKQAAIAEVLAAHPGAGIIYCSSRKRCEEVSDFLRGELKRRCLVYHAGLQGDERRRAQDAFMAGRDLIVVATNAFGMGVDKPDIRFVIHYNMPGTVEAYYQEAGRAGRDGLESLCMLLYAPGDRYIQEFFIESEYPARDVVAAIYQFLARQSDEPIELTQAEIKDRLRLEISEMGVGASLKLLEGAGALERLRPRENMAIVRIDSQVSLVGLLPPQATVQRRVLSALERLVAATHGEETYFNPHALAQRLDMEPPHLTRAIHELCSRLPVKYVRPFRGNAVCMLDRTRTAAKLGIDFEKIDTLRAREYEKLEHVIAYATTRRCRRNTILSYFGDRSPTHCGHCDNCGAATLSAPTRVETSDRITEIVRKVLSGIARAAARSRVGFGKRIIAAMLVGKKTKAVKRWGLDKLSTHGILAEFSEDEVVQLTENMIVAGWVSQQELERFKPVINLTPTGREVMLGECEASCAWRVPGELWAKLRGDGTNENAPPAPRARGESREPASFDPPKPVDRDLLGRLKTARNLWAAESQLPHYMVLANGALEELARSCPKTLDGLLAIKGIGPAKVAKYGERLLEILGGSSSRITSPPSTRDAGRPGPSTEPRTAVPSPTPRSASSDGRASTQSPPAHYWTWRLLERGFTQAECALIRGLDEQTVLDHAIAAGRDGRSVSLDAFLPADMIELLARAVAASEEMDSVLEDLPPEISEQHVQLYLLTKRTPPAP